MAKQLTAATTIPVSLEEMRAHLRTVDADNVAEDNDLEEAIWAAVEEVENRTGRDFSGHTWQMVLPTFGSYRKPITLERSPVASITSVIYFDRDNEQTTLSTNAYGLYTDWSGPSVLHCSYGNYWPSTASRFDAVTITYVGAGVRPKSFYKAVKLIVSRDNENREGQAKDTQTIDRLIDQLKDLRCF